MNLSPSKVGAHGTAPPKRRLVKAVEKTEILGRRTSRSPAHLKHGEKGEHGSADEEPEGRDV